MCGAGSCALQIVPLGPKSTRHAAIEPLVVGRRQGREHHQPEIDAGMRVALVGVDEIGNLRRARDRDVAGVLLDRHRRLDLEIAEAVAGIFENGDALIGAVRHRRDEGAHVAVGHVEQFVDAGVDGRLAVFVEHGEQIALAHLAGADQRVEIALLVAPRPHVGEDHVEHVVARLALVPDLHRRNAQAFGVDFLGIGIVAGGHRPADIGQMALADRPVDQLALVEDRLVHAGVDGVAAAEGRIVVQDQVALVDVALEELGDRLHGGDERAQMDRDILALQDHLRLGVEQRGRIVMRQVEHRGARGLLQRQRHLALRRLEHAADDRERDRIDFGFPDGFHGLSFPCHSEARILSSSLCAVLPRLQRLRHRDCHETRGVCGCNWPIRSMSAEITVPTMK